MGKGKDKEMNMNMQTNVFNWSLAAAPNNICREMNVSCKKDIENAGFEIIHAGVPGNFELDLMREGKIPDLFYSVNTLKAQELENLHVYYFTEFNCEHPDEAVLRFEGIDTVSDIYVNGQKRLSTDNMFLPYEVSDCFKEGINEVLVHIKPSCIESRKRTLPVSSNALEYSYPSLYLRKAAYMFGWDIMPRIVSAGIWKEVKLLRKQKDKIKEVFFATNAVDTENNSADMRFYINAELDGDFSTDYTVKVHGECVGSDNSFDFQTKLWHNSFQKSFTVKNCKFWYPRNYGEPHLYKTTVELYRKGEPGGKDTLCDVYELDIGIRTVKLIMTECAGDNGEFCFEINGKKVFLLGTNWVPLDAFPSQNAKRLDKALELLWDIGCNAVRCWGGGVYESDEFYRYCDRHGIVVWQDFAMGCAVYPQEQDFAKMLEEEAVHTVKRLRNHASVILWAGDNECDCAFSWSGFPRNPNINFLTREVLKRVTSTHDYTRPYLPSSPYIGESAYRTGLPTSEDHLWGPRDYFKGDYYKNAVSHFASETGYHGFPSVETLRKFLREPEKIFGSDGVPADEYLVHAASMELSGSASYAYRIRLAYNQVVTLFGNASEDLTDFVKQSQISQAEAKKYFIERFRIGKWRRTGILWWNLLDGWPQVSDAVVDYYYTKKLAYSYIKRSQTPICLMFDEPDADGNISLYGVSDLQDEHKVSYRVLHMPSGKCLLQGSVTLNANSSATIGKLDVSDLKKEFLLIEWALDSDGYNKTYHNHYYTDMPNIDYKKYTEALNAAGFDLFEKME